ncbi:hypothetical protein CDAR_234151 [Caerostris darwini]|uniref:Uncharacterized protein n=1 Tax=Caerostris darwini TaxID=1538125 RepID=A0AAV4QLA7_9ARAC|nr:hypothetical protein CDAR_234151 [Caerostris darwini]
MGGGSRDHSASKHDMCAIAFVRRGAFFSCARLASLQWWGGVLFFTVPAVGWGVNFAKRGLRPAASVRMCVRRRPFYENSGWCYRVLLPLWKSSEEICRRPSEIRKTRVKTLNL